LIEQERLRQTTAYVDAVVQTAENARAERSRAGQWGLSPQIPGYGSVRGNKRLMSVTEYPDNYL
jgi:hypothetical protein